MGGYWSLYRILINTESYRILTLVAFDIFRYLSTPAVRSKFNQYPEALMLLLFKVLQDLITS